MACFLGMPMVAYANVVWPTIYIAKGMQSWYVIAGGLAIELLLIKIFTHTEWKKSTLIAVTMNAISTIVGILLIPLVGFVGAIGLGILGELIPVLGGGTFDVAQWIFGYILTILTNVVVEGLSIKLIFKMQWKDFFLWLLLANTISVLLCIGVYGFTMKPFML